jgi:hypothetical protein
MNDGGEVENTEDRTVPDIGRLGQKRFAASATSFFTSPSRTSSLTGVQVMLGITRWPDVPAEAADGHRWVTVLVLV